MTEISPILLKSPLFADIAAGELAAMLACLGARTVHFDKGETVFAEGTRAEAFGIVLRGGVQIVRIDYSGNRSIVTRSGAGELFGESFACAQVEALPVDVIADEASDVLLIDARRVLRTCTNACAFHSQIIYNIMRLLAAKNLAFHRKLEVTSKRTTREKLLAYLMLEAKRQGSLHFVIPYDRQALADYLEVDRSGLSAEIGRLAREGVLEARRSEFVILQPEAGDPRW